MTLSDYINNVRLITRITSSVPFDDAKIAYFINSAVKLISSLSPFAFVYSYLDTVKSKRILTLPSDIIHVVFCRFYPLVSVKLTAAANANDTTLTVTNTDGFPLSGKLLLGADTYEIVSYTNKTANTFTGLTRGVDGTSPQSWAANTPVRLVGSQGWKALEPKTDVSIEATANPTPPLTASTEDPSSFSVRSGVLLVDKPFKTSSAMALEVHSFVSPPPLVNNTDTVYGLPQAFTRMVDVLASSLLLKAFGGEDALLRSKVLDEEFSLWITKLQNYVEFQLRGVYGAVVAETYRNRVSAQ